jgi:hypothetical protein
MHPAAERGARRRRRTTTRDRSSPAVAARHNLLGAPPPRSPTLLPFPSCGDSSSLVGSSAAKRLSVRVRRRTAAKLLVGRVGLEPPYHCRRHGAPPEPP